DPLNEKNENHAEHQVEQHSMGGQADEIAAIVNAVDMHARWENSRCVDLLDLCFNATDRRQALLPASHEHDALNDVVLFVPPGDAEAWLVSNDDLCDIAEKDRSPIRCRQHRIPDIGHRADESNAAHDRGLLADVDGIAAHIDVTVGQGLQNLRKCEAKGDEL